MSVHSFERQRQKTSGGGYGPAPVLGPVIMLETALPGLAILSQRLATLQHRLPAPGFLDWNGVAFHCTRPASAR